MFRDWSNTISTACEHKMEVLMLVIFFLSSVLYLALRRSEKQINLPPGPYPWPILGNLLQLGRKLHIDLASMAETNGPIFSLRLGTQPVVVASSPAVAAEILKTHDYLLSARYVTHTFRVPKYINSSLGFAFHCDERWRSLRAICKTQLFSTKMLEAQSQLRQKKVSELVGLISRKGGDAVTIGEMVFSIVFNILSNSTFSMDIISMDESSGASDLKKHISRIMEVAVAPNLEDFYPVLSGLDIQGLNREAATYIERIYGMWETLIQERREKGKDDDSNDFLKALLSSGLSDLQIKALLLDLFTAGTDTTTSLIEWTMAELVRNPEAMRQVREELIREIGKTKGENTVEEFHLPNLAYLQASIKETLRLHPPVPLLLPHRALETCRVMNYTIPKDCTVMVNVWAIGRDPGTWTDPLTFTPERFLKCSLDYKGSNFEFLPFGSGRRICPGLPLATRIAQLIVASLVHNFDWSLPHGMRPNELNMDEKFGLTLERENPLVLIPRATAF